MSGAPAECYLIQYMACFKQLGHFELLRDMLYHFCKAPQQQQATWDMSEDDFQERTAIYTCSS